MSALVSQTWKSADAARSAEPPFCVIAELEMSALMGKYGRFFPIETCRFLQVFEIGLPERSDRRRATKSQNKKA